MGEGERRVRENKVKKIYKKNGRGRGRVREKEN
jgi:hypothetical protein